MAYGIPEMPVTKPQDVVWHSLASTAISPEAATRCVSQSTDETQRMSSDSLRLLTGGPMTFPPMGPSHNPSKATTHDSTRVGAVSLFLSGLIPQRGLPATEGGHFLAEVAILYLITEQPPKGKPHCVKLTAARKRPRNRRRHVDR